MLICFLFSCKLNDIYLHVLFRIKPVREVLFSILHPLCWWLLSIFDNRNLIDILFVMNSIVDIYSFLSNLEIKIACLMLWFLTKITCFTSLFMREPFAVSYSHPHRLSSHPSKQNFTDFNIYILRLLNICSSESLLKAELDYIESIAINRNFLVEIIDSIHNKFIKITRSILFTMMI